MHQPILTFALFLFLASCQTNKSATSPKDGKNIQTGIPETPVDIRGKFMFINHEWAAFTIDNPAGVVLNFTSDSSFSGFTGCNEMFGPYHLKGDSIYFDRIGATRKACPNTPWENDLLTILRECRLWNLQNDTLTLETPDKRKIFWMKVTENQKD
ncbi:MAG: META domain-containing protein [Flavobacteriales bacterium]|nr:META domain-containing protein [Flavobacteriales bacterium]